jgi:protein TonB
LPRRTTEPKPPLTAIDGTGGGASTPKAPRKTPRAPAAVKPQPETPSDAAARAAVRVARTTKPKVASPVKSDLAADSRARLRSAPTPRALKPPTPPKPQPAKPAQPQAFVDSRTRVRKTAHIAPAGALPPARIPPEALVTPSHRKMLTYTFAISVFVHALVLAIHFSPFDLKKFADKGPPLEVALVNAKTASKPTKADILAQANLDGGGNTDENRRAKTPLPVLPKDSPTNDVAVAAQKVEDLERQTRELMTQLKSMPVAAPQVQPIDAPERTESPTANEVMQRTLEAIRLEAQIAKDMDAYQKRPKRRFIGARAEEYRFARYVEDWRLKVERIGNLNYPEAARQNKLYGNLLLTVAIKSDGSIESVEVNRTSGKRILDAAAVKIVEMAGPYAPFPPDIKRDTDVIHITRTWTFARGDELHTE